MYYLVLHFDQRLVYFHTLLKIIFIGHSFRTTLSSKKVVSKTINRFTHLENDTIKSIALSLKTNDRQTCKYWYVAKQVFFCLEQAKPHQWMEAAEVAGKG